jgi:hypothetical protein
MSQFLRLLNESDKSSALYEISQRLRSGNDDARVFEVQPNVFDAVPGSPFAYWVSSAIRQTFERLPAFENDTRTARQGLATAEDFRFVRIWWEEPGDGWYGFAKGGVFSPFYADVHLMAYWGNDGAEVKAGICRRYPYLNGNAEFVAKNPQFYLRPGITWPRRTTSGLSLRPMPQGCIFADKGPAAFVVDDATDELMALCAITNSKAFGRLVSLQLAAADAAARSYEVGVIQKTPVPSLTEPQTKQLAALARHAWSLKRTADSVSETSHAFILPSALRKYSERNQLPDLDIMINEILETIDAIAFDLYGFAEADRELINGSSNDDEMEEDGEEVEAAIPSTDGLLSWSVGVAFGRFDWRLATGEREVPPEPEPFDPLPAKSPGMLPDGAEPFHHYAGILVDDEGHQHDLPRLVEQVLETVDAPVNQDIRRWLRKDFFPFHLQQYSKSRRKAPIYWPLSTASGSYTLWLYYPELTNQTLFTAVNDFVEPKLNSVRDDLNSLRTKVGGRSKQEEKELERLEDLEQELADLRDTLLEIAPGYRPNQNDGVQITAAPLWSLFRHKPWQKVLKDTWKQLEKGDYDWPHLALNYWPDRVLHKCHEDRSLAIAHDVEELFWEEVEVPLIRRGKDTGETKLEWQPKDLSEAQLQALINQVRQERSL